MEQLQQITIADAKVIINTLLRSIASIQPSSDQMEKAQKIDRANSAINVEMVGGAKELRALLNKHEDKLTSADKKIMNKLKPVNRVIKLQQLFEKRRMDTIRELQSFFFHGASGIGKSQAVRQICEDNNFDFIDVRLPTIDPVDLRGVPIPDMEAGVARWLPAGFLPQSTPEGKFGGVILLDELNSSPPSVQAAAYQLTLDKKVGQYEVPDGWLIIAAGNRASDRGVTYNIPSPLANRFTHFEIVHDEVQWIDWAIKNELDPYVISFIKLGFSSQGSTVTKSYLYNFNSKEPALAFATPRSWEFVSKLAPLRDVNIDAYFKSVKGTVGEAAGGMFQTYIMFRKDLPDPIKVLEGKEFDMPNEIDSQFVMISMLIETLNKNFNVNYLDNFVRNFLAQFEDTPRVDIAILGAKEMLTRFSKGEHDKTIDNSKEFVSFIRRHKDTIRGF